MACIQSPCAPASPRIHSTLLACNPGPRVHCDRCCRSRGGPSPPWLGTAWRQQAQGRAQVPPHRPPPPLHLLRPVAAAWPPVCAGRWRRGPHPGWLDSMDGAEGRRRLELVSKLTQHPWPCQHYWARVERTAPENPSIHPSQCTHLTQRCLQPNVCIFAAEQQAGGERVVAEERAQALIGAHRLQDGGHAVSQAAA